MPHSHTPPGKATSTLPLISLYHSLSALPLATHSGAAVREAQKSRGCCCFLLCIQRFHDIFF